MNTPAHNIELVCSEYTRLTQREARPAIYERTIWDWLHAGFTVEELVIVIQFIQRDNKKHEWQYSLKLGVLLGDHVRFSDLLAEAKQRLRIKPQTAQDKALAQLRPTIGENLTATNTTTPAQTQVIAALRKAI